MRLEFEELTLAEQMSLRVVAKEHDIPQELLLEAYGLIVGDEPSNRTNPLRDISDLVEIFGKDKLIEIVNKNKGVNNE